MPMLNAHIHAAESMILIVVHFSSRLDRLPIRLKNVSVELQRWTWE